MKFNLRLAEIRDISVLTFFETELRQYEKAIKPSVKSNTPLQYNIEKLFGDTTKCRIIISTIREKPVGCALARIAENESLWEDPLCGYMGMIYVEEKFRGKGIAKCMMNDLVDWLIKSSIKDIRLQVMTANQSAISMYEKYGFASLFYEMKLQLALIDDFKNCPPSETSIMNK